MALNARYLDHLDYRTYVLMGDGESAEGGVWEAAALAAHYQLDNLVAIVDVNRLGQSQATMHGADAEAYARKFSGFGWHSMAIDGHNLEQILNAFNEAQKTKNQPSVVVARTKKGKGVSFLEDKDGWHGKPLKKGEEVERALRELPLDESASATAARISRPPAVTRDAKPASKSVAPPDYKAGDLVATREAYGTALIKLGSREPSRSGDVTAIPRTPPLPRNSPKPIHNATLKDSSRSRILLAWLSGFRSAERSLSFQLLDASLAAPWITCAWQPFRWRISSVRDRTVVFP